MKKEYVTASIEIIILDENNVRTDTIVASGGFNTTPEGEDTW